MTQDSRSSNQPFDPEPLPAGIIDRYLAGEATVAEEHQLAARRMADPKLEAVIDALRQAHPGEYAPSQTTTSAATADMEHVVQRLRDVRTARSRGTHSRSSSSRLLGVRRLGYSSAASSEWSLLRTRWAMGAIAGVVGLIVWGVYAISSTGFFGTARPEVYTTANARPTTVTLRDGTTVILAPHTTLQVASRFGAAERSVELVGEAYFDVASAAGAPFIVHTGTITTRVLGTAFTVQRYGAQEPVRIAVMTGKVSATGPRASVVVSAGSLAHITDSTATTTAVDDVRAYADWTRGRLVFEDTPVTDVLAAVGRWYGYRFQLTDSSIARRSVSTVLKVSDSAETMAALKSLLDVTLTFDDSLITVRPRRAQRSPAPTRVDAITSALEMGR